MKRSLVFVLFASLLFVFTACSNKQTSKPAGQPQSPAGDGGGGSSLSAAAAKVTDACSLVPADLIQKLVPGASAPLSEQFPKRCTFSNGTSALGVTIGPGPSEAVQGAEFVSGLAEAAYLERLDPVDKGDAYLTVIVGKDPNGINYNLNVEVAGHDGKEHKDDAVNVASAVLERLQ